MTRFAALAALTLGVSGFVQAQEAPKPAPKPEPPKTEEKKPVDVEANFKKMDADKDGKLTLEEFKAKKKGKQLENAEARFKKFDKDSDSKVTLEEFKTGQPKPKA